MLFIILLILLVLSIGGGGWGSTRFGYASWSPLGIIMAVLVIAWLTGNLHCPMLR